MTANSTFICLILNLICFSLASERGYDERFNQLEEIIKELKTENKIMKEILKNGYKNSNTRDDCNCDLTGIEESIENLERQTVSHQVEIGLLQSSTTDLEILLENENLPIGTITAWTFKIDNDGQTIDTLPKCKIQIVSYQFTLDRSTRFYVFRFRLCIHDSFN